jgi:anti-anti-sigma regulatory factor
MTVKITQIDEERMDKTILKIEGKLTNGDAEILEQTVDELAASGQDEFEIDLSGITFINSESAAVLKRLEQKGATLTGQDFFIQKVIETYEAEIKNKK